MEEIYILGACRTGTGSFGGSLASVPVVDIAKTVIKESVQIALQIVPFLPVTVPTSLYGVVNSYLPHYSRASRSAALNHMYNGKDGLRDILQQRARSAAEQMQRQRQAAAQRQQYQRQAA